jgi:hypothetical protein
MKTKNSKANLQAQMAVRCSASFGTPTFIDSKISAKIGKPTAIPAMAQRIQNSLRRFNVTLPGIADLISNQFSES